VHVEPDAHVDSISDAFHHAVFDAEPVELVCAHRLAQHHCDVFIISVTHIELV
jgi:hypothetical protein